MMTDAVNSNDGKRNTIYLEREPGQSTLLWQQDNGDTACGPGPSCSKGGYHCPLDKSLSTG